MPATVVGQSAMIRQLSNKDATDSTPEAQVSLPKLPVPNLHETLEQYLLCVKPLVGEMQFEATKTIVEEFGRSGGLGEVIQEKLIDFAKSKDNWGYEWWLNDMYMNNRAALPVNSNPGMVLPKQNFADESSRLKYAAKLTSGILDFKVILDARALPIDVARGQLAGQSLCMEQYYRLLNSYRLPGYGRDQLVSFGSPPVNEPEHIIVACNNQFFVVHVTLGNYRLSEADFAIQFERILQISNKKSAERESPVGILTSIDRNDWSEARNILITDPINRASFDAMERCVFVLCLDQSTNANSDVTMAHQMLHGSGPELNSSNRWYDKTIQLIISADGTTGLSYEHSASEGIAVIALIEHLLKYISIQERKGLFRSSSTTELPTPQRLQWNVDNTVARFIELAQDNANHVADTLDLEIFRFMEYGKDFIKRQNISPDAYVQVALQITYYKLYDRLVSTYESASTRRFRKGRVDNIRAATVQVLELAKSLTESDNAGNIKLDANKMLLLRRAIKAQTDFTISAITGHGIDCHLLGLKMIAEEMGLETLDIFTDPSYVMSNYFQLSTSQIPTSTDSFMCYGAVVPDGYGVSYNPHNDSIVLCVSSFRTCPSTSSEKFVAALGETLQVMRSICQKWNRHRSSSLEHLLPRKFSIHRRMKVRSNSGEGNALREDFSDNTDSEEEAENTIEIRGKSFPSQKILSRQSRTISRALSLLSNIPTRSSRHKLNRRFSDVAISRPMVQIPPTTPHSTISTDLMTLLKQQSVME